MVRVQDVEGLVDIYLAPPEGLAYLPMDLPAFATERDRLRRELGPSERFPTLESSLAWLGVTDAALSTLTTQSSQTGALRLRVLAEGLREVAKGSPSGIRENEPTRSVTIWIQ